MPDLTIGEVARRTGLRPSAIRFYESTGVLPPQRRVNGRRRYDDDIIYLLAAVQIAKRAGFTVAGIRQLLGQSEQDMVPSAIWSRFAEAKLRELDDVIKRAQEMKQLLREGIRCGCLGWEQCALVARELVDS
jgi:MerR family redox-sensitive transcriptional activator SoxR